MNLRELDDTLPNGLHDLLVERLSLDFARRIATFEVSILVGTPDAPLQTEKDVRRNAHLVFQGLQFCVMETPDPQYPYAEPRSLWLPDLCEPDISKALLESLPSDAFVGRFFVNQWNAFLCIAATDVTLTWE